MFLFFFACVWVLFLDGLFSCPLWPCTAVVNILLCSQAYDSADSMDNPTVCVCASREVFCRVSVKDHFEITTPAALVAPGLPTAVQCRFQFGRFS